MTNLASRLFGPAAGMLVVGTAGPLVLASATARVDVIGALTVAFLGGWLVSVAGDPIARLGPHPLAPTLPFVPVLTAILVQSLSWLGVSSVHWNDVFAFLMLGVLGGTVLTAEIQRRYLEGTIGGDAPKTSWTGPPAPKSRVRRIAVAIVLFSLLTSYVVAWLAGLEAPLFSPDFAIFVVALAAGLGGLALVSLLPTEHALYDAGLVIDDTDAFPGRFVPADRLEGYSLTDDALVFHRREPWIPDVRFDRAAIDDPAGVIEELEAAGVRES